MRKGNQREMIDGVFGRLVSRVCFLHYGMDMASRVDRMVKKGFYGAMMVVVYILF